MNWSASTDNDFRPGMRVGAVFAVTHTDSYRLFFPRQPTPPHIRALIENDEVQRMYSHLDFRKNGFNARTSNFSFIPSATSPDDININFEMDGTKNFTYLSFLGALLGTPDYFFAIRDPINMCTENGSFALQFPSNTTLMPVTAYDAGYNARKVISDNLTVIPEDPGIMEDNRTSLKQAYGTFTIEQFEKPVVRPCFPASATVTLDNGNIVRMDEVKVGDRVAVGGSKYSEVFMFTHKMIDVKHEFVEVETSSGAKLRLTEGHYLPVNKVYRTAGEVMVDDSIWLGDGTTSNVVKVERVMDVGLYNPQTTHGDIVVNGVRASTYTRAVEPKIAHAMLTPLRMLSEQLRVYPTFLDAGADYIARFTSIFL